MPKPTYRAWIGIFVLCFTHAAQAFSVDDAKQPVGKTLYEIFSREGIEAALNKYHELKREQVDAYDFSETELNSLGYKLVREKKLEAAIAIFELNTQIFPKSANALDSLGEAYLRAENHEVSRQYYEKALAILESSDLGKATNANLKDNVEAKLAYLRDPASYRQSTELTDFLANNEEYPYGRLHPKAPPETEHWGRLAGEWDCSLEARSASGEWVQRSQAKWVWKYILDGFAVQDLWYVKWLDTPPQISSMNRDFMGTNVRMYKPKEKKWEAVWLANARNTTSRFDAISDEDEVVMTNFSGKTWTRITFHNFTENTFDWKSESSTDEGKTWTENTRIYGKRVR